MTILQEINALIKRFTAEKEKPQYCSMCRGQLGTKLTGTKRHLLLEPVSFTTVLHRRNGTKEERTDVCPKGAIICHVCFENIEVIEVDT